MLSRSTDFGQVSCNPSQLSFKTVSFNVVIFRSLVTLPHDGNQSDQSSFSQVTKGQEPTLETCTLIKGKLKLSAM